MEQGTIYINRKEKTSIPVDTSEVYRYLGYSGKAIGAVTDKRVAELVDDACVQMHEVLSPQAVYAEYPVLTDFAAECSEDVAADRLNFIDMGFMTLHSESLAKNLQGCEKVIVFAATIGAQPDRLIQKYSLMNPLMGVVMQAVGAMFIESYCDVLNRELNATYLREGLYARPRFSPGYGDFPLESQKAIFAALRCSQKIGLTLMDTLIMAPSKSVTAVIGYHSEASCDADGIADVSRCAGCEKKNCEFRRE